MFIRNLKNNLLLLDHSTRTELLNELLRFSTHMNALFSYEQVDTAAVVANSDDVRLADAPLATLTPTDAQPVASNVEPVIADPVNVEFIIHIDPPVHHIEPLVDHPMLLVDPNHCLSDEMAIVVHPTVGLSVALKK